MTDPQRRGGRKADKGNDASEGRRFWLTHSDWGGTGTVSLEAPTCPAGGVGCGWQRRSQH
jgi:hypothetical protein